MTTVFKVKNFDVLIDDIDADLLDFQWYVNNEGSNSYVRRTERGRQNEKLHRVIMARILGRPLSKGEIVEVLEDQTTPNHLTFVWSYGGQEPKLWTYTDDPYSLWGIELVVIASDYTPTLEANGRKVTLLIDPGPGYNKGRMTYYLNEGWGVFNANIRLTPEIMRDLIAVMMYCLEHEDEIRT